VEGNSKAPAFKGRRVGHPAFVLIRSTLAVFKVGVESLCFMANLLRVDPLPYVPSGLVFFGVARRHVGGQRDDIVLRQVSHHALHQLIPIAVPGSDLKLGQLANDVGW
jgi:hypothetical protein